MLRNGTLKDILQPEHYFSEKTKHYKKVFYLYYIIYLYFEAVKNKKNVRKFLPVVGTIYLS